MLIVNYVDKNSDSRCPDTWSCPFVPSDVNGDGGVNSVEVVLFVNYVYKNTTPFPCDPSGT